MKSIKQRYFCVTNFAH